MGSGVQTGLICDPERIYIPSLSPVDLGEIPSFIELISYVLVFWKIEVTGAETISIPDAFPCVD